MLGALLLGRLRAWTVVLAAIVAVGAWGPTFARLLAEPHAHACHCEMRGGGASDCACPICFPEIGEVDALGHEAVTGTCGDEDRLTQGRSMPAVTAASFVLAPASSVRVAADLETHAPPSWRAPPDPEPPEAIS